MRERAIIGLADIVDGPERTRATVLVAFVMSRHALTCVLCAVWIGTATANGRPPGTSTINFRKGMEAEVIAGMTFGLLWSRDGGATWEFTCEDAVGYGGTYDPDYAYISTGAVVATTFDGMKIARDECRFEPSPLAPRPPMRKFFSVHAQGPDGALYFAASDPGDGQIYKSTDGGMTFPVTAMPGLLNDWWQSLEVAPSDPNRVYLTGYRSKLGEPKQLLLFRSVDGGVSYQALSVADFAVMSSSSIEIAGISKTDPDLVFARVTLEDNALADAIYRSTDGGQSWARVLGMAGSIAFVVRAGGDLVAGAQLLGMVRSTDNGTTWNPVLGAPHVNCLVENSAGEVWACTQNYGSATVPADGFGIMKSMDLATWTGVLRYQNIKAPVACPVGTEQHDTCDVELWCGLCKQLGCDAGRACPGDPVDPGVDGPPPDGATANPTPGSGCCDAGARPRLHATVLVLLVGWLVMRPRRSRHAAAGGTRESRL